MLGLIGKVTKVELISELEQLRFFGVCNLHLVEKNYENRPHYPGRGEPRNGGH